MTSRVKIAIAATDSLALSAGEQASLSGASALGSALWAYLVVAGSTPGVLLSPVSILLVGFGARRAIDGRVRQPGLGAGRPRGFKDAEVIPIAARVGVPMSLAAVFVAFGYDDQKMRSSALTAAARAAKRAGAIGRAFVFEQAKGFAAGAFRESAVAKALIGAAAPGQGGLVTQRDFADVPQLDLSAAVKDDGASLELPWNSDVITTSASHAIVALDRRGTAVVLCYESATSGLEVVDGELLCPTLAVPVMRGVARVAPGTPLPQRCDARIELDAVGLPQTASNPTLGLRVCRP